MFKKCMYLYLSLFFMNMHSIDDSVVQGHKLITLKMVPYMKTIADIVGDLGLDMVIKDTYLSRCKEWTQKPMFAPTLELLSECIDVIKHKQVNSLEEEDWNKIDVLFNSKRMSTSNLIGMLQVVDFFSIDLLEDIILNNIGVSILLNPNKEFIVNTLNSIPQIYHDKLKRLLFDCCIKTISDKIQALYDYYIKILSDEFLNYIFESPILKKIIKNFAHIIQRRDNDVHLLHNALLELEYKLPILLLTAFPEKKLTNYIIIDSSCKLNHNPFEDWIMRLNKDVQHFIIIFSAFKESNQGR